MKPSDLRLELQMFFSVIAGLFAGRTARVPPLEPTPTWVAKTKKRNYAMVRDILSKRLDAESSGIETVRRRAEFGLTALLAIIGVSATGFERIWSASTMVVWPLVVWACAAAVLSLAILALAGVAVGKKVLGIVDPGAVAASKNAALHEIEQHVGAIAMTSSTRRGMVTVFRDAVLVALVGLVLLVGAHVAAWLVPVDESTVSTPVVIILDPN